VSVASGGSVHGLESCVQRLEIRMWGSGGRISGSVIRVYVLVRSGDRVEG